MATVPEEHLTLCETCGYILEGLSPDARCPECGTAVSESTRLDLRVAPEWEIAPGPWTFLATSAHVLFRPDHFFRHLLTRTRTGKSLLFGIIWRAICSILLAIAMLQHMGYLESRPWQTTYTPGTPLVLAYGMLKVFSVAWIFLLFSLIDKAAAWLTAWEAGYRGFRLPLIAVQRGLRYHSVHLMPVCLAAAVTTWGYELLLGRRVLTFASESVYLYTLCGEVIFFAAYLFFTYWAAMRNMLYANR